MVYLELPRSSGDAVRASNSERIAVLVIFIVRIFSGRKNTNDENVGDNINISINIDRKITQRGGRSITLDFCVTKSRRPPQVE